MHAHIPIRPENRKARVSAQYFIQERGHLSLADMKKLEMAQMCIVIFQAAPIRSISG